MVVEKRKKQNVAELNKVSDVKNIIFLFNSKNNI